MDKLGVQLLILFVQLIILYPVIQRSIYDIFRLTYVFTRSKDASFALIAVIFLPGTIIHEMSHFIAAMLLLLPVGEVQIMPEWHDNKIRFGKVTYAKADVVRSVLVGIAPVFGAIGLFIFIYLFHLFPSGNIWLTAAGGYLLFSVTANMFSSKQDLVDLIYIIPVVLILGIIWYLSGVSVQVNIPVAFSKGATSVLQFVNFCITISLAVHIAIILFIRSLWLLFNR